MSEKNGNGDHLNKGDLKRAEKGTDQSAPLVANEEDAFVPDTELDNPDPTTKESARKNDPSTDDSAGK